MQHILIVDDTEDNIFLLEDILKDEGYRVSTASDGAQALKSARINPPDLIISDILMPVMDGYKLCREWHADKRLCEIPFMFYSSTFTNTLDRVLAFELGADRFEIRPQDAEALLATIRELLSSSVKKTAPAISDSLLDEHEVLKEYSESLFQKLEKKMGDLETANRNLAESENNFRQFVMECPVPIAVSDISEHISLFNYSFTATFGYTSTDLPNISDWWLRAYPEPVYRTHVKSVWLQALEEARSKGGRVHADEEFHVTCKDGSVRYVNIYAAPVSNGLVVVFNDTTEKRQSSSKLQQMQNQIIQQEKMASVGQLAAGVAHEINNPMGFITSNLTSLAKYASRIDEYIAALQTSVFSCPNHPDTSELDKLRQKLKVDYIISDMSELINESLDGASRVRRIVQDLKSFSRVDQSQRERSCLNDILDTTINIAWNEIKYIATLEKNYGEIPYILCFPQQLNQVFLNLLVNAAQAMESQGVITVTTWADNSHVCVSVADTGKGMTQEICSKVFEPFFTTKEAGKGTGLGMAISSDIIQKHGGEITVTSEPGSGTTFTVRLPMEYKEVKS